MYLPLRFLRLTVPVALTVFATVGHAQLPELPLKHTPRPTHAKISAEDLMTRLYIFADDSMAGRAYRTAGNIKATDYLAAEFKKLGLEPAGDSGSYFQTLGHKSKPDDPPLGRNVIAIVRGTDPTLNHTYVAIGAHNDHVGINVAHSDRNRFGLSFSRPSGPVDHDSLRAWLRASWRPTQAATFKWTWQELDALDSMARTIVVNVDSLRKLRPVRLDSINNGADDDGSGTVAMLEIAEALAKLPAKPKRSILFVSHTGEEGGGFGSGYFMEHPTVPRDSIIAQVNLDMIGRGTPEDMRQGGPNLLMVVGASRISTELGKIVEAVNTDKHHNLRLDYTWDAPGHPQGIYGRSDQASYAERGIPAVLFFTGLHADYHRVTDEPQYIDYPHLEKITKYLYDLMLALGNRPARPVVDRPVTKDGGS